MVHLMNGYDPKYTVFTTDKSEYVHPTTKLTLGYLEPRTEMKHERQGDKVIIIMDTYFVLVYIKGLNTMRVYWTIISPSPTSSPINTLVGY